MKTHNNEYTKKKNTKKQLERKAGAIESMSTTQQRLRQFKDGQIPIVITNKFALVNEPMARKMHYKNLKNGLVDAS
jgi:hypothetical protein